MNRVPQNIRLSLIATWLVDCLLYVLGVVMLYLSDTLYGDNLLPVTIHNISFEAFGYYVVDFAMLVIALFFRLKAVDKAVSQYNMTFVRLSVFSIVPLICSVPFWFYAEYRVFAMMLVAFAAMQMLTDAVAFLKNEFAQIMILMLVVLIFTAANIGFVHLSRVNLVYKKAVLLYRHCQQSPQWMLPSSNWSVAFYEDGKLVRSEGNYGYIEELGNLYNIKNNGETRINSNGAEHFVFAHENRIYVVSKATWSDAVVLFINITMIFSIYMALSVLLYWVLIALRRKVFRHRSFFSQLRVLLLVFLLTSLFVVFLLIIGFVSYRYVRNAIDSLETDMTLLIGKLEPYFDRHEDFDKAYSMVGDMSDFYNHQVSLYDSGGRMLYTSDSLHLGYNVMSWVEDPFMEMDDEGKKVQAKLELDYNNNMRMRAYGIIELQDGRRLYAVMWSEADMARTQHEFSIFLVILLVLYFILVVFAVVFSFFVSRLLAKPLHEIDQKMSAISLSAPNTNSKIVYPVGDNDELTNLIRNYNAMVDKLEEAAAELALIERENSWRDISRQIAHEIKNPLTPMRLILQQMMMNNSADIETFRTKIKSQAAILLEQVDTLYTTACSLSDFARQPVQHSIPVDIVAKVHHVADLFRHNDSGVQFEVLADSDELYVLIDKNIALRIFINLVRNAIQAIPDDRKGVVKIEVKTDGSKVRVSVSDNGVGISPDAVELIFNTNYTTKTKGMGLGLCVVKDAVEASGGDINVITTPNVGSSFVITWPRYIK